jgi:hypothetical protein
MPRTYSPIDKIRAELAWVNETPDPNKCGCRHVRCCEETEHKPGAWAAVAMKFWTFSWSPSVRPAVNMDGAEDSEAMVQSASDEIKRRRAESKE